jgi:hypothetical protein
MLKSGVTPQPKAEHERQLTLTRTGLATAGFIAWLHFNIFCRWWRSLLYATA